jgi:hypothetical protein
MWPRPSRACAPGGSTRPTKAASRSGSSRRWGGRWTWSSGPPGGPGSRLARSRLRCRRGSTCCGAAGWWRAPSHKTCNPLLTSKPLAPMIGHTGLLSLLTVVARLHAGQQDCACAPQEAGVSCPSRPPNQSIELALPPAVTGSRAQSLGSLAASQSAPALASARSPRRTAVKPGHHEPLRQQRGGRA